jgi:hypothetical protein
MFSLISRWFARTRPERRDSAPLPVRPHLVRPGDQRDTGVAVPPPARKTPAFIAGDGARIYSLAAFRRPASIPHLPGAA